MATTGTGNRYAPRMANEMDRRVTTVEVQLLNIGTRLDRHIEVENDMIERLEASQHKQELQMARLIGGLIVAQFLAILFAPTIRAALGLGI